MKIKDNTLLNYTNSSSAIYNSSFLNTSISNDIQILNSTLSSNSSLEYVKSLFL